MSGRFPRAWAFGISVLAVFLRIAAAQESTPPTVPETMTLDEAVQFALEHHPQIQIAEEAVRQAKANLTRAIGTLLPQLTVNGSFTYTGKLPRQVLAFRNGSPFGGPAEAGAGTEQAQPEETPTVEAPETRSPESIEIEFGTKRSWRGALQVKQAIFTWGRALNAYRQLQLQYRAAQFALERSRQTVRLNVQEAFYGVLLARTVVEVSQAARDQAQQRLDVAQKRLEVGSTTRLEVLQAKVALANAEAQLIRAQNALMASREGFVLALGLAPNQQVEAVGNLEPIQFEGELTGLIQKALVNRPDLREALFRDEANRYLIRVAAAGNKPMVAATATYAWMDTERQDPQTTWSIGVGVNFPVFDGFATRAQKRQAEAAKHQSEAGLTLLKSRIVFEAQQAYRRFAEAQTILKAQEEALNQAEEALRIANISFANGIITGTELASAQLARTQTQLSYNQALHDALVAFARLEYAVGVSLRE